MLCYAILHYTILYYAERGLRQAAAHPGGQPAVRGEGVRSPPGAQPDPVSGFPSGIIRSNWNDAEKISMTPAEG